jgi:hypothetical protein
MARRRLRDLPNRPPPLMAEGHPAPPVGQPAISEIGEMEITHDGVPTTDPPRRLPGLVGGLAPGLPDQALPRTGPLRAGVSGLGDGEAPPGAVSQSPDDPDALVGELLPLGDDPASHVRNRLAVAKRDATGFITEAVPHITRDQLRWLTHRLETGDDKTACDLSSTDPFDVLLWMADPGFRATYEAALDNKREGFRVLTAHLLPSVIRSLQTMLDSGSNKDKKEASMLILRAQGLMVDKANTIDPNAVASLFSLLRQENQVEARILDVRTIPRQE